MANISIFKVCLAFNTYCLILSLMFQQSLWVCWACWCVGVLVCLVSWMGWIYVYFCDSTNTKDTLDKTLHAWAVLYCLHNTKQTIKIRNATMYHFHSKSSNEHIVQWTHNYEMSDHMKSHKIFTNLEQGLRPCMLHTEKPYIPRSAPPTVGSLSVWNPCHHGWLFSGVYKAGGLGMFFLFFSFLLDLGSKHCSGRWNQLCFFSLWNQTIFSKNVDDFARGEKTSKKHTFRRGVSA